MRDNHCLVSNVPFWGKVLKQVVASQLQRFLHETKSLDSFQCDFSPDSETETAMITWVAELFWGLNKGSMSLLVLQDSSATIINHIIFCGMGLHGAVFTLRAISDAGVGEFLFDTLSIGLGCPLGFVLYPTLFTIQYTRNHWKMLSRILEFGASNMLTTPNSISPFSLNLRKLFF